MLIERNPAKMTATERLLGPCPLMTSRATRVIHAATTGERDETDGMTGIGETLYWACNLMGRSIGTDGDG